MEKKEVEKTNKKNLELSVLRIGSLLAKYNISAFSWQECFVQMLL